jgi:DNA-binding response OmpR family regulator
MHRICCPDRGADPVAALPVVRTLAGGDRPVAFPSGGRPVRLPPSANRPVGLRSGSRTVAAATVLVKKHVAAVASNCYQLLRIETPPAQIAPEVTAATAATRKPAMPETRPILIVEDDAALRATLAEQIALAGGFRAVEAATAAEATAKLDEGDARYDTVLLDIGLPDGCGRELCAKLRRDGKRMPVIMLTGADAEQDVVRGLDAGANDYIANPFRAGELLARVRAQLRVFDNSEDAVFTIGPYTFRPAAKLLLEPARNRKIRLTDKEVNILKFLYRAGGRPVGRQALLHEVWGYSSTVTTHTLETHIYRLRQKMEPDPSHTRLLLTAAGGYLLDPRPGQAAAAVASA